MHTLTALVAVVTACLLARAPVTSSLPTGAPPQKHVVSEDPPQKTPASAPEPIGIDDYLIPQFLRAPQPNYDDSLDLDGALEDIYREYGYVDNTMDDNVDTPLDIGKILPGSERLPIKLYMDNFRDLTVELTQNFEQPNEYQVRGQKVSDVPLEQDSVEISSPIDVIRDANFLDNKKGFALTPLDTGYFLAEVPKPDIKPQETEVPNFNDAMEPRQTRQNPNLSRTKTLVASNLDKLRAGLSEVPGTNAGTEKPDHIHIYDTGVVTPDSADSIYGIALVAAVSAALMMAIVGFAFGWYTLSKRAKAAADVDYPAYGVTGPTAELAGDRKLAHSAHMYHYQHQKQQILAMERNCVDQRNGSVSDPESEEENEEGDYTVYECPGFATTGEMEVKNPLFTDDKTPATPGKCEVVKPQLKE